MCFGSLMGPWLTTALKPLSKTEKPIRDFCLDWGFREIGSCVNALLPYFNFNFMYSSLLWKKSDLFYSAASCELNIEHKVTFIFLYFLYWSAFDLQCCVSFRCTAKWISYTYTYILLLRFPFHLGHHRALSRVPCAIQ